MTYNYGTLTLFQLILVIFSSSFLVSIIIKNCNFNFKKLILERNFTNFIQLVFIIILIVLLVYLSAFRKIGNYGTNIGGYDAYSYKSFFEGYLKNTHFEPGFVLLVKVVRLITNEYSIFLIITSLIMIFCMIIYLNKTKNCNFYLIVMLICIYFSSFNTLRMSLAIFISLLVLIKLNENKYMHAIILTLISSSIHISAFIMFPIILLNYIFKNKQKISAIKIIFLVLLMSIVSFMFSYFSMSYLSTTSYESYVGNGQIVVNVYLFLAVIFYLSVKRYSKLIDSSSFNKVLIISLPVVFLVFPMQLLMVIMYRMIEFFLPIAYTLMAQILKVEKKYLIKVIIICLFFYKIVDFFLNSNYIGIFN